MPNPRPATVVESLADDIRVGPAGWQYPDWQGVVYPASKRRDFDALTFIASYFNVIEINSTFYRAPAPKTSRSWAERVSHFPDFRFTLKALHRFTHTSDTPVQADFNSFAHAIEPLSDSGRLACVLLQFPWSFKDTPTSRKRISILAEGFDPVPVAVEVRHGSWASEGAWQHLRSTGLTVCGIDQPVIGNSLRPGRFIAGTAGVYFRLHGRNYRNWFSGRANRDDRYDYLYSRDQLQPWVEIAARVAKSGTPVNIILNNHFRGQAPANAFEIMAMLSGKRVRVPSSLVRSHQRLENIADGDVADGWLFDRLPTENNEKNKRDDPDRGENQDMPR